MTPYACFPVPDDYRPWEASVTILNDGGVLLVFSSREGWAMLGMVTRDLGRTWEAPYALRTQGGGRIEGCRSTLVRLKSGALGLIYNTPWKHFGRDGALRFHKSTDEGKTWSEGGWIDPRFSVVRNGTAFVAEDGRIMAPAYHWITPHMRDAEQDGVALSYSYMYYSDDEGDTWQRSVNELVLRLNEVAYEFVDNKGFEMTPGSEEGIMQPHHLDKFGEPAAAELNDGRVLLYGRTRMGRIYQSTSGDRGETWSVPRPTQVNSSDSPASLMRIPSTGDLLLIVNQATPEEIQLGMARHRLSTAISKDDGKTWAHFQNLESLDDESGLEPPPIQIYQLLEWQKKSYDRPQDTKRYHRIPGYMRATYADAAFTETDVVICYDCGRLVQPEGPPTGIFQTKVVTAPIAWLYG